LQRETCCTQHITQHNQRQHTCKKGGMLGPSLSLSFSLSLPLSLYLSLSLFLSLSLSLSIGHRKCWYRLVSSHAQVRAGSNFIVECSCQLSVPVVTRGAIVEVPSPSLNASITRSLIRPNSIALLVSIGRAYVFRASTGHFLNWSVLDPRF
jgi:hypothetical protein